MTNALDDSFMSPWSACLAARAGRPIAERVFRIHLPGIPNWPSPEMVALPPGSFLSAIHPPEGGFGWAQDEDPYEGTPHHTQIRHDAALGRHPVTVAEFAFFLERTGHDMGDHAWRWEGGLEGSWREAAGLSWRQPAWDQDTTHPVVCVSWDDAQAYIGWLNNETGLTGREDAYRLPTESEAEYACRADRLTSDPYLRRVSDRLLQRPEYIDLRDICELKRDFRTRPVWDMPANGFGLRGMDDNSLEWCADRWHDEPQDDDSACREGYFPVRVLRGHACAYPGRTLSRPGAAEPGRLPVMCGHYQFFLPRILLASDRDGGAPDTRYCDSGLRLARTLLPESS